MRRDPEAAKRAAARREREDTAPRLQDVVPKLADLALRIEERDSINEPVVYIRRIVVDRAPAHFELPCTEKGCTGGHDVTDQIMQALEGGETAFEGDHACAGETRDGDCKRTVHFTADASYS